MAEPEVIFAKYVRPEIARVDKFYLCYLCASRNPQRCVSGPGGVCSECYREHLTPKPKDI